MLEVEWPVVAKIMKTLNETKHSHAAFRLNPCTALMKPKPHSLRWLLALSIIGGSTVHSLPALAQAKAKTTVKAKGSPSASTVRTNQLKVLRGRSNKARFAAEDARKILSSYPVFRLQGTIERGTGQDTLIYGTAFGLEHTPGNAMGWATEKKFLTIHNYRRSDVDMDRFQGSYMAVSQTEYAPVPAAYDKALDTYNQRVSVASGLEAEIAAIQSVDRQQKQQIALAQKARVDAAAALRASTDQQRQRIEAQTLIAQFQAPYLKQLPTWTEPEQFLEYSEASVSFYRQKVAQSAAGEKLYASLRDDAIVQGVKAATIFARRGAVDVSAVILTRRLWTSTPQRPEAAVDMAAIYSAQNFGAPASALFNRQSALLDELLAAWAEGFPIYAKEAPYDELLAVRKVGEVLARSAGKYALPQRGLLVTALKGGTGSVDATADGQVGVDLPVPAAGSPVVKAPAPRAKAPRKPAFDFPFRNLKTGKNFRLSDFRGKVVVLYLGEFQSDDGEVSPSRIERFAGFAKDFDPTQVVFLCVLGDIVPSYLNKLISQRSDPRRAQRGEAVRQYPDFYTMSSLTPEAPDGPQDRKMQRAAGEFYNGKERYSAEPVTVIDAQGQVVGAARFVFNPAQSEQNAREDLASRANTGQTSVYEFDKDALDALIIEALAPAK